MKTNATAPEEDQEPEQQPDENEFAGEQRSGNLWDMVF